MLSPQSLTKAREQFGIASPMPLEQSLLQNRTKSLDTAWSAPKMALSTPQSAPRNPIMDALVSGSKKFVAGGVPGLFQDETPSTFKDALREGIKARGESLGTQLTLNRETPEVGLPATIGGFAGMTAPVKKVVDKTAPAVFEGFQDISTKILEKLKGKSVTSRQEILDFTNSPDLKQAERDLIRRVLGEEDKNVFYHGDAFAGYADSPVFTPREGLSLTPDISIAENYAVRTSPRGILEDGAKVREFRLNDKAKVLDATDRGTIDGDVMGNLIKDAKARGYDAVRFKTTTVEGASGAEELHVINPKVVKERTGNDQINVPDFANKVKSELLPLTIKEPKNISEYRGQSGRYENVNLPDELRGPVANYKERVYESPIKTSAGEVHFSGARGSTPENYFAHTRIEDLPGETMKISDAIKRGDATNLKNFEAGLPMGTKGTTRRVIEIQSDLFQKGRLEGEVPKVRQGGNGKWNVFNKQNDPIGPVFNTEAEALAYAGKDTAELEPYRNTWHERVIREEVKQAAKDGKTKLQFPTGETAMKIEGLGDSQMWTFANEAETGARRWGEAHYLEPGNLKVGLEVNQYNDAAGGDRGNWIITDVLGDGKFKAVPKETAEKFKAGRIPESLYETGQETFDISGKVDTENPIYKFYEKNVQKYLTNKYGGKVITDPQGVKWVEIDIKPEYKGLPVEAFGAGALPLLGADKEYQQKNSTPSGV